MRCHVAPRHFWTAAAPWVSCSSAAFSAHCFRNSLSLHRDGWIVFIWQYLSSAHRHTSPYPHSHSEFTIFARSLACHTYHSPLDFSGLRSCCVNSSCTFAFFSFSAPPPTPTFLSSCYICLFPAQPAAAPSLTTPLVTRVRKCLTPLPSTLPIAYTLQPSASFCSQHHTHPPSTIHHPLRLWIFPHPPIPTPDPIPRSS